MDKDSINILEAYNGLRLRNKLTKLKWLRYLETTISGSDEVEVKRSHRLNDGTRMMGGLVPCGKLGLSKLIC